MIYTVNGFKIATSSQGRTGYHGATVCPKWTLDYEKPFIAMTGNPKGEPELEELLTAKKRKSLHLGKYADTREAAYVVAMYKENPKEILEEFFEDKNATITFPKELYDLPEYMTIADARSLADFEKSKKTGNQVIAPKKERMTLSRALVVARDFVSKNKNCNIKIIRREIETAINSHRYVNENCVEKHLIEII